HQLRHPPQLLHSLVGDPGTGQPHGTQLGHRPEVCQPIVGHLRLTKVEIVQTRQTSEVGETRVCYCSVTEVQYPQVTEPSYVCQSDIGDRIPGQPQFYKCGHAPQVLQSLVPRIGGRQVECTQLVQPFEVLKALARSP